MRDEFDLEDGTYSPDNFYTKILNPDGSKDGTIISAKIAKAEARLIEEIAARRKFPVKTQSDFVRDAIHHRLWYLRKNMKELEKEADSALRQYESFNASTNELERWDELVSNTTTDLARVKRLVQGGLKDKAYELAMKLWDSAQSFDSPEEKLIISSIIEKGVKDIFNV